MLLEDKTVVISGVGAGLGQALAKVAAREGARLVLAARNIAFVEAVRAEIVAGGGEAIAVACNVGDADQCAALADAAVVAFGAIHGLVNSAYLHGDWSLIETADAADMLRSFDINCLGALRMTKACVSHMGAGAAIVNVSTMATMRPFGTEHGLEMGYAVSKGALNTLSKYMAVDLGRKGIRVNTCRLGWIYGAPVQHHIDGLIAAGASESDVIGAITKDIPIGIIPPEEDCAKAILMLLSDYSRVVSGASLDINGGHWVAP